MIPIISFAFIYDCKLLQHHLVMNGTTNNPNIYIDLVDNTFGILPQNPNNGKLYIGQQCKKYHYQVYIEANINENRRCLENIKLNRQHFVKQIRDAHFVINSRYDQGTTLAVITNKTADMREIVLPVIDFDFHKKKLIARLRTIELLA